MYIFRSKHEPHDRRVGQAAGRARGTGRGYQSTERAYTKLCVDLAYLVRLVLRVSVGSEMYSTEVVRRGGDGRDRAEAHAPSVAFMDVRPSLNLQ